MKKRLFICTMVTMMVISICGCSASVSELGSDQDKPKLLIGIDSSYEPYTYVDENGNYVGLDIEIAKEACKRMDVEPVFVAIKWDSKNDYLADGSIDCIWSCFSMNGRESEYTWVGPYMYSRQVVAVADDSDINDFSDLNGKSVAVMSTTKPESIFLEQSDSNIPTLSELYSMENMDYVFTALQYGYVDAVAGHEITIRQYMESTEGEYRLLDEELLEAGIGIAFDKDNPSDMTSELESVLSDMDNDGVLDEILEKYGIDGGDGV